MAVVGAEAKTKIQTLTQEGNDTKATHPGIVVGLIGFMLRMHLNVNHQLPAHLKTKLNPEPEGEARRKKLWKFWTKAQSQTSMSNQSQF